MTEIDKLREIDQLRKQLAYEKERREELLIVAAMPHLHRIHPYEFALLTGMLTGPRKQRLLDTMLWGWGAKKVHSVLAREHRRKRIYYEGRYHHKQVEIEHLRIEPKGIYRLSSLTNIDVNYLLNF